MERNYKMNKLSNSAVDKYIECSLCYKIHYIDRVRPVRGKSALLFGGALDEALNHLLLNYKEHGKDSLVHARAVFAEKWLKVDPNNTDFFKSDLDQEIVDWNNTKQEFGLGIWDHENKRQNSSWYSLFIKGNLFVTQYYRDILPKIKNVVAIQEPVSLKNSDGDEITGILDLIVEWRDGKVYLMDNKSSSVKYAIDSAKTGQQLPLYFYIAKDKYKLDGVGYIVLSKKINKNRVKECSVCGKVSDTSHKTCAMVNGDGNRCGGSFNVSINPSVDFDIILNNVEETDEQRVIETFDMVNQKIINKDFALEHPTTKNKYFQWCPYHDYYEGNPNFIKLPQRE